MADSVYDPDRLSVFRNFGPTRHRGAHKQWDSRVRCLGNRPSVRNRRCNRLREYRCPAAEPPLLPRKFSGCQQPICSLARFSAARSVGIALASRLQQRSSRRRAFSITARIFASTKTEFAMIRFAIVVMMLAALRGCAVAPPAAAAGVRDADAKMVENCKYVGEVDGSSGWGNLAAD